MSRGRRGRRLPPGQEIHLAGVRATSDGVCARCDEPVLKEQRVVPARGGRWMHVGCASGGDE